MRAVAVVEQVAARETRLHALQRPLLRALRDQTRAAADPPLLVPLSQVVAAGRTRVGEQRSTPAVAPLVAETLVAEAPRGEHPLASMGAAVPELAAAWRTLAVERVRSGAVVVPAASPQWGRPAERAGEACRRLVHWRGRAERLQRRRQSRPPALYPPGRQSR